MATTIVGTNIFLTESCDTITLPDNQEYTLHLNLRWTVHQERYIVSLKVESDSNNGIKFSSGGSADASNKVYAAGEGPSAKEISINNLKVKANGASGGKFSIEL